MAPLSCSNDDSHSEEPYFCVTVQDINEQKILQAQSIPILKAGFHRRAGGIAHEINQPLNVMRLATMNLRNHLNKQSLLDSKASGQLKNSTCR